MGSRKNYVIDGQNLQFYLGHGMKLDKIHRCLKYEHSPWLRPYIELNSKLRAQADNEGDKDFFKLMNNSVYGQTLMDVTKFTDFEYSNSRKKYQFTHRKQGKVGNEIPFYICVNCRNGYNDQCSEEGCFIGMEMNKSKVMLNRPIIVGFKILELAKLHMYQCWYDVLKVKYEEKIHLLMTDTDSFICQIFCKS